MSSTFYFSLFQKKVPNFNLNNEIYVWIKRNDNTLLVINKTFIIILLFLLNAVYMLSVLGAEIYINIF